MSVTAERILSIARGEIGTKAIDVKKCVYNTWFYGGAVSGSEYDWCAAFVCWVFYQANALNLIHEKNAGCGYMANAFRLKNELVYNKNFAVMKANQLKEGDVVFFHWSGDLSVCCPGVYTCDHVGIVEKVNADNTITTIEGNTGGSLNGEVMRRVRSMSVVSCAGRPAYTAPSGNIPVSVSEPEALYRVRAGGKWYKEVNGLSSYAGVIGTPITDVAIKVTQGKVRYRVHIKGGSWLPYVTGYDISDDENGYAGDKKPIDAIEIYYSTPPGLVARKGYYKAKYRVSPLNGAYYPYQYDDEKDRSQDGYAGVFGRSIDRLVMTLSV
jgi:hypothetical protein